MEDVNVVKSNLPYKLVKLFIIASFIVAVDYFTKAAVIDFIPFYGSINVIPDFFNIIHIYNPGGAFGFLAKQPLIIRAIAFLFISGCAICLIVYFYIKTPESFPILETGLAIIVGGAAGNMIDRLRFGAVLDFLDFYIGDYHWPAFNIADSAISIGIFIFALQVLFKKMPE